MEASQSELSLNESDKCDLEDLDDDFFANEFLDSKEENIEYNKPEKEERTGEVKDENEECWELFEKIYNNPQSDSEDDHRDKCHDNVNKRLTLDQKGEYAETAYSETNNEEKGGSSNTPVQGPLKERLYESSRKVCPFYQKGHCKFGNNCCYMHSASIAVGQKQKVINKKKEAKSKFKRKNTYIELSKKKTLLHISNSTVDKEKMLVKKRIIVTKKSEKKANIANLPKVYDRYDIRQAFESFGEIGDINLVKDRITKEPTGTCCIEFNNIEDNYNFVKCMNGKEIEIRMGFDPHYGNYELPPVRKKKLSVEPAHNRPGGEFLNISGLPKSITSAELTSMLTPYGKLKEKVNLPLYGATNLPLGFSVVRFENKMQAKAAIEGLNGREVVEDASKLIVRSVNEDNTKVWVGNISRYMSNLELIKIFSQFGAFATPMNRPMNAKNGNLQKHTTIKYHTKEETAAAIEAMSKDKYRIEEMVMHSSH